jgi:hypothetical protein
MKIKCIRNLFLLSLVFSQTVFAAANPGDCLTRNTGNTLKNLDGSYCELKDGPVTCLVFDPFGDGGGISCTVNKGSDLGLLATGNKHFKLKAVEGDVTRINTGRRLCYIYAAYRGGTPSCLNL